MILDTNALSALISGDEPIAALLATMANVMLPVIVLGEYRFGLERSTRRETVRPQLGAMEAALDVLSVDAVTARHYADIRVALARQGRLIPQNDLWIAALARQYGLPVLSQDKHFDYVPGLQRISW